MVIVIACIPPDVDRAIDYYRWVKTPLNYMLGISWLPLLFAIIVSWVYFSLQTKDIGAGYAVSSTITILGITIFIMTYILIRRTLIFHFKPDSSSTT